MEMNFDLRVRRMTKWTLDEANRSSSSSWVGTVRLGPHKVWETKLSDEGEPLGEPEALRRLEVAFADKLSAIIANSESVWE